MTSTRSAWGWGLATVHESGQVLDTWFPRPQLGSADASSAPDALVAASGPDPLRRVSTEPVFMEIDLDAAPAGVSDAYLRLHLLSARLAEPRSINLDGIFGALPNVVWTSAGPCAVDGFEDVRASLRLSRGQLTVFGVDKFPRMVDYVVPSGVRIADADRVRLGAHLAAGTTVMHEGFVNFNAGTLGTSMVEGRISAGVVVGEGSDIGGGAVGISLGDDCVVEAGLYLTSGTKVALPDGRVVKARELSGSSGLLFLRDSQTGAVIAKYRAGQTVELNAALHAN